MPHRLHDDELEIGLPLVRALVDGLDPTYAALPLRPLMESGSSNVLFRLGEELLVRLPRQPGGTASIEKEARWLPRVAPHLPVAVPEVVSVGAPAFGYPERWSVVRWLPGNRARRVPARDLADLVIALRSLEVPAGASEEADLSWYRGDPLVTMDAPTRRALEECRFVPDLDLDLDAALAVWTEAMELPGIDEVSATRWFHGDLVAENLLVRDGRLTGVLDFGGLAVGDPTVDLAVAWDVLDAAGREKFRIAVGADPTSWLRGRAWALALAVMTFPYYSRTMPERCASRLEMARAVLADAGAA